MSMFVCFASGRVQGMLRTSVEDAENERGKRGGGVKLYRFLDALDAAFVVMVLGRGGRCFASRAYACVCMCVYMSACGRLRVYICGALTVLVSCTAVVDKKQLCSSPVCRWARY